MKFSAFTTESQPRGSVTFAQGITAGHYYAKYTSANNQLRVSKLAVVSSKQYSITIEGPVVSGKATIKWTGPYQPNMYLEYGRLTDVLYDKDGDDDQYKNEIKVNSTDTRFVDRFNS